MTRNEFKQAQIALGLTNTQCAEYLGVSRSAVDKYRSGEVPVPPRARIQMTMLHRPPESRSPAENKVLVEELAGYVMDPRLSSIINELWLYFDALEQPGTLKENGKPND